MKLVVFLSILASGFGFPGSTFPFAVPAKRSPDQDEAVYHLPSPHADQLHEALKTVKVRSAYQSQSQSQSVESGKKPVEMLWVPIPVNKKGKHSKEPALLPIPISEEIAESKSPFKIVILNSNKGDKGYGSSAPSIENIEKLLAQLEPITQNVGHLPVQQHHVQIKHVRGGDQNLQISYRDEPVQDKPDVQYRNQVPALPPAPFRETAQKSHRNKNMKTESYLKVQQSSSFSSGQKAAFGKGTEQKQNAFYAAKQVQTDGYPPGSQQRDGQYSGREEKGQSGGYNGEQTGYSDQQKVEQYGGRQNNEYNGQQKEGQSGGYGSQQKVEQYNEKQTNDYGGQQKDGQSGRQEEQNGGYGGQQKNKDQGRGYSNQIAVSSYVEEQKDSQYGGARQEESQNNGYGGQYSEGGRQENVKEQVGGDYSGQKSGSDYSSQQKNEQGGRSYGGGVGPLKHAAGSYVHVEVNSYGSHPQSAKGSGYRGEVGQQSAGQYSNQQTGIETGGYKASSKQTGTSFGRPKPFGKAEVRVTVVGDDRQEGYSQQRDGYREEEERGAQYVPSSSYSPIFSFDGPSESPRVQEDYGSYQSSTPSGSFGGYGGDDVVEPNREFQAPNILQSYSHQEHSQTVHEGGSDYGSSQGNEGINYGPQVHVEMVPSEQRKPQMQIPSKLVISQTESYSFSSPLPPPQLESYGTPPPLPFPVLHVLESLNENKFEENENYEQSGPSSSGYEQSGSDYGNSVQENSGYEQSTSGYKQSHSSSGYEQQAEANSGYGQSQSSSGYSQSGQSSSGYGKSEEQSSSGYGKSEGQSSSGYGKSEGQSSSGYGKSEGQSSAGYGHSEGQSFSGYGKSEGQSSAGYGHSAGQSSSGYKKSEGQSSSGYGKSEGQSSSGYGKSEGQSSAGYGHSAGQSSSGYGQSGQSTSGYGRKPSRPAYPQEEVEEPPKPPCADGGKGYSPRPSISIPEMFSEGPKHVSAAFDKYQGGVQVAPPPIYPPPQQIESGPSYRSNDGSNYGNVEGAANNIHETFQENQSKGKPFYIVIFQKQKVAPSY